MKCGWRISSKNSASEVVKRNVYEFSCQLYKANLSPSLSAACALVSFEQSLDYQQTKTTVDGSISCIGRYRI